MKSVLEFDESDELSDLIDRFRSRASEQGFDLAETKTGEHLVAGFHADLVSAAATGNQIRLEKAIRGTRGEVVVRALSSQQRSNLRRMIGKIFG